VSPRAAEATPARAGFAMPAEWDSHEATWLGFPHNVSDWPGRFGPIPWAYAEIVRKITTGERVELLVNDAAHEAKARRVLERVGVTLARVRFRRWRTNRGWTRDFGPMFVRKSAEVAIVRFRFTGWAKYPDHGLDDKIPERAARALELPLLRARRPDGREVVLEGGSIDVNGQGTLLTTEECLLDP
jgi:agmatine deiminase